MPDQFEGRVRAAAIAGWWVLLAAVGLLTASWLAYLAAMASHPEWLKDIWGPDVTWDYVENVWFWAMAAYKLILWFFVLLVLWLTLWARQLRKHFG
ncbi:MAG TPA: hypothetical protein VHD36_03985 [Pirellulales bacterium]|nr:hypothetical protein [Pirellulales bacterium]